MRWSSFESRRNVFQFRRGGLATGGLVRWALALAVSLVAAGAEARAKPSLTPSQIKARYLTIDFRTPQSERVHFSLDRLQYQNPHYKMLDRQGLKDLMLNMVTADLAKPAELFPEIYQDWGDTETYSLKLGRGECAV